MALKTSLLPLLFWAMPLLGVAQTKYALLVGVSQYQDKKWRDIHGAEDVAYLAPVLKKRNFTHIIALTNAAATQKSVADTLRHLARVMRPGDMLIVHFSVHGQQIFDLPPYDEHDGRDESLILYDCPFYQDTALNYQGERHLLDDELDMLLFSIRQAIGSEGQILGLYDACHSGDVTRHTAPTGFYRGTQNPLRLPQSIKGSNYSGKDTRQFEGDRPNFAPMISFFGTESGQLNYEIQEGNLLLGSLTKAFVQHLERSPVQSSYQLAFENIQRSIHAQRPGQRPDKEGNLARRFMGGSISGLSDHILAGSVVNNQFVNIDQGWLAGLYQGTEMAFYPADTWDTTGVKPLARGAINKADLFGAQVRLNTIFAGNNLEGQWGYITKWQKQGKSVDYAAYIRDIKGIKMENTPHSDFDLDVQITVLDCDQKTEKTYPKDTLRPGDCYTISIRNLRKSEVYFNIVDFPVGVRDTGHVLVPYYQDPYRTVSIPGDGLWQSLAFFENFPFRVDPLPLGINIGKETLKIIVSDQNLNLHNVIKSQTRGVEAERGAAGVEDGESMSGRRFAIYDIEFWVKNHKK